VYAVQGSSNNFGWIFKLCSKTRVESKTRRKLENTYFENSKSEKSIWKFKIWFLNGLWFNNCLECITFSKRNTDFRIQVIGLKFSQAFCLYYSRQCSFCHCSLLIVHIELVLFMIYYWNAWYRIISRMLVHAHPMFQNYIQNIEDMAMLQFIYVMMANNWPTSNNKFSAAQNIESWNWTGKIRVQIKLMEN
jgi:hypothetical protein